ncbi:MAG: tRNA (N6-threonylcarbamoyladenosine(37)-N6)-methyltransferase TrmO [Clostridia bacterium]|nr:tRNA (N6-threonylcarbamoyladenosine(37)-N6)-methyltransferase TrmO [Clostridia bacterium]
MKVIARIHTDFTSKFGIPRQSSLVQELEGTVIFEPEYRNPESLRGLDSFTHIWLLWEFSANDRQDWSPTVRPPRLGGNKRVGVFATRSPFRPNPIGMSCVKLTGIEKTDSFGTVLHVSGADILDNTPIYDIKPYLPYVDSHPEASNGFALAEKEGSLKVNFPTELLRQIPTAKHDALIAVLSQDPRPSYQEDENRVYGMEFAGFDVRFTVKDRVLTVTEISEISHNIND